MSTKHVPHQHKAGHLPNTPEEERALKIQLIQKHLLDDAQGKQYQAHVQVNIQSLAEQIYLTMLEVGNIGSGVQHAIDYAESYGVKVPMRKGEPYKELVIDYGHGRLYEATAIVDSALVDKHGAISARNKWTAFVQVWYLRFRIEHVEYHVEYFNHKGEKITS